MRQITLLAILCIYFSLNIYGQDAINVSKVLSEKCVNATVLKKTEKYKIINSSNDFEPTYFVLGTLSDYMGRFQYIDRQKQVDRYYPGEAPMVDFLVNYIRNNLKINVDTVFEESRHSEMYSKSLAETLNTFYGENDELMEGSFNTDEQINSFLAGAYYRYGEKIDSNIYKIQLANSPKHQNCYNFLKHIGCNNIFYKYLKNIPAQFILYFEPTDELKKYLDIIEPEKFILKESNNAVISKMMNKSWPEIEDMFKESQEAKASAIREMFKK